ncbi:MAG: PEP-utilizing enzyme [Candidatus Paceibacterota bacterium]|jgi:phosphohistidine swiveling domain-containing protein
MESKFIKYITRDYSLRDRSIVVDALLKPGVIKEIYYTAVIEHRHDNVVDVYVKPEDNENNTERLNKALSGNSNYIKEGLLSGIKISDQLLEFCSREVPNLKKDEAIIELREAKEKWQEFSSFLEFTHRIGSMGIDLDDEQLKELGEFHEARKKIFLTFFAYLDRVCEVSCSDDGIIQKDFKYLLFKEIILYLEGKMEINEINELQSRRIKEYVYENYGKDEVVTDVGADIYFKDLKDRLIEKDDVEELKGVSVTKGKISGEVVVVTQANYRDQSLKDKIVVISMTTTSMNAELMGAKAIITEEGGLLCHAAIFSREFNIITLTKVKNATSILKTGDMVEVDADTGIIRVIK